MNPPNTEFLDAFLPYCYSAETDDNLRHFVYGFENGLGASIIWYINANNVGTHGAHDGLWELALLEWDDTVKDYDISYDYYLGDVTNGLTEPEVLQHLRRIARLVKDRDKYHAD